MINISIIFPGNGNYNFKKILLNLYNYDKLIKKIFYRSSKICKLDLLYLIKNDYKFNNDISQIIIVTLSYIIFIIINKILKNNKNKINNIFLSGYSLGEYTSLLCSNILKFDDLINILIIRNGLINKLKIKKKITIIILLKIKIKFLYNIINKVNKYNNEFVAISVFNSENSFTISGYYSSINIILEIIKKYNKIKKIFINLDKPYHTNIIKPIKDIFKKKINNIKINNNTEFKITDNINSKILYNYNINDIKNILINSLFNSIKWNNTINLLIKNNVNIFLGLITKFFLNISNIRNCNKKKLLLNKDIIFFKKYIKNV